MGTSQPTKHKAGLNYKLTAYLVASICCKRFGNRVCHGLCMRCSFVPPLHPRVMMSCPQVVGTKDRQSYLCLDLFYAPLYHALLCQPLLCCLRAGTSPTPSEDSTHKPRRTVLPATELFTFLQKDSSHTTSHKPKDTKCGIPPLSTTCMPTLSRSFSWEMKHSTIPRTTIIAS